MGTWIRHLNYLAIGRKLRELRLLILLQVSR